MGRTKCDTSKKHKRETPEQKKVETEKHADNYKTKTPVSFAYMLSKILGPVHNNTTPNDSNNDIKHREIRYSIKARSDGVQENRKSYTLLASQLPKTNVQDVENTNITIILKS